MQFFMMVGTTLAAGVIYAWMMSFAIRSSKRFFLVAALIPLIVASVIPFVNGNIGAGVAIGGAFGLSKEVRAAADELLSFSRMTFTHQMVRLLLVEQIYRAFKINRGEKYHW